MRRLKIVLPALWMAGSILASIAAAAAERKDFTGVWLTDKAAGGVEIVSCGSELCGHIYSILVVPNPSIPLNDNRNKDPKLRSRSLCGLRILSGLKRESDTTWGDGSVYDPESGKTYSVEITLQSPTVLAVRGYVGTRVIGRTVLWTRPTENLKKCSSAKSVN